MTSIPLLESLDELVSRAESTRRLPASSSARVAEVETQHAELLQAATILRAFASGLLDSASMVTHAVSQLSECFIVNPDGPGYIIAPRMAQKFKPRRDALLDIAAQLLKQPPPPTLPEPLRLE